MGIGAAKAIRRLETGRSKRFRIACIKGKIKSKMAGDPTRTPNLRRKCAVVKPQNTLPLRRLTFGQIYNLNVL